MKTKTITGSGGRINTGPQLILRDDEQEPEEKLSPAEQLRRDLGRSDIGTNTGAGGEEKLSPAEQLRRDLGKDKPERKGPTVIKADDGGTDWAEAGRWRPGSVVQGYQAPDWYTDDPEELERQLGEKSDALKRMQARMQLTAPGLRTVGGALETASGNLDALDKRLNQLTEIVNDESRPVNQRRSALDEVQALLPYYQRDEEKYNSVMAWYQRAEKQTQGLAQEYNRLLSDFQNTWKQYGVSKSRAGDRAAALTREGDELAARSRALASDAEEYFAVRPQMVKPGEMDWSPEQIAEWQKKGAEAYRESEMLSAQSREKYAKAAEESARYKGWQSEQLLSGYGYDELRRAEDWGEKSLPDRNMLAPKKRLSELSGVEQDPRVAVYAMYGDEDTLNYAIINGSEDAMSMYGAATTEAAGGLSKGYLFPKVNDKGELVTGLSEEERALYNYLYATDKEKAKAYLDELTPLLTDRWRKANAATWRKYAEEDPVGTSAFSVLLSPTKAISRVMQIADMITTGKPDENAPYNQFSHIPNDIRKEVSGSWGKWGQFAYNTGMSIADFLWNAALTGDLLGGTEQAGALTAAGFIKGMTRPSIVLMGLEAAADSYIENRERGLDHKRAYILSSASGLIEALTENLSLEVLMNPVQLKSKFLTYLVNLGQNALAEGSEEANSDLLNWAVDSVYDLVSGMDDSEYKQMVRQYMADGMSAKDAAQKVLQERYEQLALDALGGALSGGVMGGGQSIINTAVENRGYSLTGKDYRVAYQDLIREGMSLPEGSEGRIAAEELMEKLARGKRVTNQDVGRLVFANEETIRTLENRSGQDGGAEAAENAVTRAEAEARTESQGNVRTPDGGLIITAGTENAASAREAARNETETIVNQLRSNSADLMNMEPVAVITGNELPSSGRATDRAMEFLKSIGNKVTRSGLGEVLFSRSKVKTSLVGHGAGQAKIETIAAVPAVIQHGKQLSYIQDYDGRGYDTYLFGAPVTYRGSPVMVGVVVAKDRQSGRYYVHEVVDSDGNIIMQNESPESNADRPPVNTDAPVILSRPSGEKIAQSSQDVNAPVITAGQGLTRANEEGTLVITAGTQNEQGVQNGQQTETAGAPADGQGTELPGRNGGRDAGERTGEQAEGLGRGAKNWRTLPQAQKAVERQNRGKRVRAQKVSGKDLGVHGATDAKTAYIYPEEAWDEELRAIDAVAYKATGQHVTFILGSIAVPGTASGKVRGVNAGGRIIVQADCLGVSATQLFAHEIFHEQARNDPTLVERVKQKIIDRYSREEFEAIVDKYLEKKAGAMDLSKLDEAAMQRIIDKCTEEVCADAYAGINAFGQQAGKYVQEARAAMKEARQARETEAATERRTGPPEERYSTAEEVLSRDDVDWMDNWSSIKDQLAEHAEELKNMEPVAVVRYNHNPKESIIDIMMNALPRIGGGKMKNSGVGFIFDRIGAKSIDSHATGPEGRAVALAAPYVAKYGKLIAGQKNHEGTGLTTLTFAAPAIINGDTANVGVVVQFDKDGRPRAVNAGSQSGGKFKLKTNEAFRGTSSRVDRYGQGTALDTRNASKDRITQTADESNTKFSEAEDADTEYLSAVERGDMETAQQMVDEAAEAAGYTVKGWHGTLDLNFTVFLKDMIGSRFSQDDAGFFFTSSKSLAEDYATSEFDTTRKGRVIDAYLKAQNPLVFNDQYAKENGFGRLFDNEDPVEVWDHYHPFILEEVENGNNDSVVIDDGKTQVYVVFNSEQIKSAAPVTYDDAGSIIPLSERFNPEEQDIRFSADDTASRAEELRGELRRISDTAYREGLRASDLEAFNRNEERRKQLRREIAKLGAIEPQLRQAEAELEQRRDIEYQKQLLEDGGVKAVQENERKIKDLTKKVAKLKRQAGRAEAEVRNAPEANGTEERTNAADDGARNDGAERSARTNEMDSVPESAAKYTQRKERGTLPMENRDRIAALKEEIKNRKDSNRLMQMHVDQGPEAVAREIRSIQKLERELRDLETPQLPKVAEKKPNTEAIPESSGEYAQRKRLGTLPKTISEKNQARIAEIREALETRDTEAHKAEIFNTQGAEALAAEVNAIKRLRGELNRLEQGDRPKAKPSKAQVTWAKRDLANTLMGLFSIPNSARKDMRSVIDHYADLILKNGDLDWRESSEFRRKLWESGEVLWKDEEAGEIYSWLRNSKIYAPDYVRADFGDDWNEFRKKAWGLGIYLTNDFDDAKWDSLNMELAESFPGLFDADETDPRTVLERIVQLADEGRGEKLSLGEYAAKVAGVDWASEEDMEENLDRQLDWALRTFAKQAQVEQYYKGKMGERVTQEREAAAQRLDEAVAKERQRGDRRVQEAQNRGKAMLEAERTREALRRGREKEARREAEQRKRERAVLRELQDKTLRQLQWISRNKNKFPQEMKARVEDILRDMDIYAVSMADEMHIDNATGKTWRDLADIYLEAKERDPNWMPSKDLDRIVSRLNDKKISELDPDALRTLFQAAVGLRTELYNRNNLINDLDHRTFEEMYDAARGEIENAPGGYDKRLPARYAGMQLTPMNRMEQMAGWDKRSQWYSMAKMLEQGERDSRRFQTEAKKRLGKFLQENQDWVKRADGQGKDAIWYEIEVPELLELGMGDKPIFGDTVKVYMTPAQKVELYLESKGYDNLRHMTGGRTFADRELYSQGKRAEALAQGKTIRLAPETVRNLVKDLTPEEQGLADLLEQFYNGYSKKEINRVSNLLYGYDKAMEEYYAPIYTNDNYTKSEPGVFDLTAEGVGNLKERKVSTTPSLNLSAFDAFERSVDKTGKFVGLAIPIRNMNTLLNWWGEGTSMADTITHKWGEEGLKFIQDLLTELQSGREKNSGKLDQLVNGALNKYISSVFGFNPSIVLKQFASYPLAGAYLGYENMPKWIPGAAQVDTDLISKYTGELDYRMLGYSTPETAALKDNPGVLQTKGPLNWLFGGGAITWMDGFTVRTLWTWAENKVNREQPGLERGTEAQIQAGESEYYQAVAKEFEEAVSRSQPMYDTMHRSDIMRQSGAVTRAFTMFKTVPQQEYNMLRESFGELQAAKHSGDAERIREARGKAGRSVLGILTGNLMIGAITFLNALWKNRGKKYRDDDGDLTLESVMSQMGKQYFKDAAGLAIGGDAAADLVASWLFGEKLYDIDSPGIEQVNELYQAIQKAGNTIGKLVQDSVQVLSRGGDWGRYMADHSDTYLSAVVDAASILGTYAAGLPVENVKAYLLGALGWMSPKLQVAYEDALNKADKSGLKGLTGDALEMRMSHILRDRTGNAEEETVSVLSRLYEAGMTEAVPPDTPSSVTVGGESRKLGPMEAQTYSSVFRNVTGGSLDELVNDRRFRDADAKTREKMLSIVYDYARDQAKAAVWGDYKSDQEKAKAVLKTGVSLEDWAAFKATADAIKGDDRRTQILELIDSIGKNAEQKDALYYAAGYKESTIDDAPWRQKKAGGSGGDKVYAPANLSGLRLPPMPEPRRTQGSGLVITAK